MRGIVQLHWTFIRNVWTERPRQFFKLVPTGKVFQVVRFGISLLRNMTSCLFCLSIKRKKKRRGGSEVITVYHRPTFYLSLSAQHLHAKGPFPYAVFSLLQSNPGVFSFLVEVLCAGENTAIRPNDEAACDVFVSTCDVFVSTLAPKLSRELQTEPKKKKSPSSAEMCVQKCSINAEHERKNGFSQSFL